MAVNVSARNMHDLRFPDLVDRLISETGARPENVELEITEYTVGLDRSTIRSVLGRLHKIGVSLSIDDFGTGYSSMAQLRELPVDRIKIDRSFVTNMAGEDRDAFIVSAIVRLAQALDIEAVAEGVEAVPVADMLRSIGCTVAQGWLFGRPMLAQDLSDNLPPAVTGRFLRLHELDGPPPAGDVPLHLEKAQR